MIRVLIMSDSHGNLEHAKKVIEREQPLNQIIHLGDILCQEDQLRALCHCPVTIVKGNCDIISESKLAEVVTVGGHRIFATHGHQYGVATIMEKVSYAAEANNCDIALYGHTHVPDNTPYGGVIAVNPGSISEPRQMNHKPTYAMLTIDEQGKMDISIQYA